jgi:outer membrane assembly lipoprotein YfiO
VLALCSAGCAATSGVPKVTNPADRVAVGRDMAERGDCVSAIEVFKSYISTSGGSADVDQAIYFLGICYLKTKEYDSAAIEFERLIRDYPESDSAAAASFQLGEALFGQTRPIDFDQEFTERAIRQWQGYMRAFPGHWQNGQALERVTMARTRMAQKSLDTGNLYIKLRRFEPARVYFRRVIEDYGDTPAAGHAWLGLAMCDVEQGLRQEAVQRLREIEQRFAGSDIAARAAARLKEIQD